MTLDILVCCAFQGVSDLHAVCPAELYSKQHFDLLSKYLSVILH